MYSLIRLSSSLPILRKTIQYAPRRNAHTMYRDASQPPPYIKRTATALMATMWFWIMWRCYHEPGEVVGHFAYPKPHKWTDQELGIPPDEED